MWAQLGGISSLPARCISLESWTKSVSSQIHSSTWGREVSSLPCGTVPGWWCQTWGSSLQSHIQPLCLVPSVGEHQANWPRLSIGDSLGLSGSKPVLISLVKGSLVLQSHVGPSCLSALSHCQNWHDKDPTGSVKNHLGENLSSHHHPVWAVLLKGGSLSSFAPDKSWLAFISSITDYSIACPLHKICFRVSFCPNLCIFVLQIFV